MLRLLLLSILSFSIQTQARSLSLNDLSILLPLPSLADKNLLLSPFEEGSQGPLLSSDTFQLIVPLVPEHHNSTVWNQQLKVIAVRLDPCFIEGEGPLPCRRQIRLVWQPVIPVGQELTTRDAAIHSFYEFSAEEFQVVLNHWQKLASGTSQDALQVHPVMKAQGLRGTYWTKLRQMILQYCGERNLVRMTAMNVMANEQLWIFAGFDIKNGQSQEIIVPRVQTRTQAITQSSFQFKSFAGGMTPNPPQDEEFNKLVEDSWWVKKKFSETQVRQALRSARTFENPKLHDTASLDCASCHLANMALQWGEAHYPQFNWASDFNEVTFKSTWNLTNPTKNEVRPNQFRIFGYFGKEPAIAQRVINESAVVADYLKGL